MILNAVVLIKSAADQQEVENQVYNALLPVYDHLEVEKYNLECNIIDRLKEEYCAMEPDERPSWVCYINDKLEIGLQEIEDKNYVGEIDTSFTMQKRDICRWRNRYKVVHTSEMFYGNMQALYAVVDSSGKVYKRGRIDWWLASDEEIDRWENEVLQHVENSDCWAVYCEMRV